MTPEDPRQTAYAAKRAALRGEEEKAAGELNSEERALETKFK